MRTVLVGFTPDAGGHEALAVAGMLAAGGQVKLVVAVVVPKAWGYPVFGNVDQEYGKFLDEHAAKSLDEARAGLRHVPNVEYLRSVAASPTEGLIELARVHGASCVVIGSARHGSVGRLMTGSVSDEIMHACDVPVLMAPREYQAASGRPLQRLTVAYAGSEGSDKTVRAAVEQAQALGVPLRVASFAVRDHSMYPTAGVGTEEDTVRTWTVQAERALTLLRAHLAVDGVAVETAVGAGTSWDDAMGGMTWYHEELLVLGSSRLGLVQRVFLGSNANKILRASPVPVMVLPRGG